jgi:hypothetical protein
MSKTFSQTLVNKCIEYFKRVHNTDISVDTANEYLHSFARLYLAYARPNGGSLGIGTYVTCEKPTVAEKSDKRTLGVSNTQGAL